MFFVSAQENSNGFTLRFDPILMSFSLESFRMRIISRVMHLVSLFQIVDILEKPYSIKSKEEPGNYDISLSEVVKDCNKTEESYDIINQEFKKLFSSYIKKKSLIDREDENMDLMKV